MVVEAMMLASGSHSSSSEDEVGNARTDFDTSGVMGGVKGLTELLGRSGCDVGRERKRVVRA